MYQLLHIAQLAAPPAYQTLDQPPQGRPALLPTLMACAPLTHMDEEAIAAVDGQPQLHDDQDLDVVQDVL